MGDVIRRFGEDRRDAEALQHALDRLERLLDRGVASDDAHREAARHLEPAAAELFALATGLRDARSARPEPAFVDTLATRLRAMEPGSGVVQLDSRRAPAPLKVFVSAAASFVLVLGLLVGGARSLPGDVLYPVKRTTEAARVAMASGTAEAMYRVELADRRLKEVDGLLARAASQAVGGPGLIAAAAATPSEELTELIADTLSEAKHQMELATPVLVRSRNPEALERLATVARKGSQQVARVAQSMPAALADPDVAGAGTALREITVKAEKARAKAAPSTTPTPGPCATPSPTPEPTPVAEPTPTPQATPTPQPTPTPQFTPSPSPTPDPTPEPTPCVSPTPSASPSPTPEPPATPTVRRGERPKPTPDGGPSPTPDNQEPDGGSPASPQPTPKPRGGGGSGGSGSGGSNDGSGSGGGTQQAEATSCSWFSRLFGC